MPLAIPLALSLAVCLGLCLGLTGCASVAQPPASQSSTAQTRPAQTPTAQTRAARARPGKSLGQVTPESATPAQSDEQRADAMAQACPGMAGWVARHPQDAPAPDLSAPTAPALRAQLLALAQDDQDTREQLFGVGKPPLEQNPAGRALLAATDSRNLNALYHFIADYDLPTRALVGSDGMRAFWLLVQHAADTALQKRVLGALATQDSGIPRDQLALLDDRIAVAEGRAQKYGSQFHGNGQNLVPWPIEDVVNLDPRREQVGLPPFEDYRCVVRVLYGGAP